MLQYGVCGNLIIFIYILYVCENIIVGFLVADRLLKQMEFGLTALGTFNLGAVKLIFFLIILIAEIL